MSCEPTKAPASILAALYMAIQNLCCTHVTTSREENKLTAWLTNCLVFTYRKRFPINGCVGKRRYYSVHSYTNVLIPCIVFIFCPLHTVHLHHSPFTIHHSHVTRSEGEFDKPSATRQGYLFFSFHILLTASIKFFGELFLLSSLFFL